MKDKLLNGRVMRMIFSVKNPGVRRMVNGVPQYNDGNCNLPTPEQKETTRRGVKILKCR